MNETHNEHVHEENCSCCAHDHSLEQENKTEALLKIITGVALFIAGYVMSEFTSVPEFIYLICFGVSYMLLGFNVVRDAVEGIMKNRFFDENFLMTVASLGAFAIHEYSEGCAVMLLYTVGEYLQGLAVSNSRKSISTMLGGKAGSTLSQKNHSQQFITRFARIYTPIVCILSILIILIPPLFMGGEWREWIHRGLGALVVSCPCAIVVSVPLAYFAGIGACSKRGIYVIDSDCIEKLKNCKINEIFKGGDKAKKELKRLSIAYNSENSVVSIENASIVIDESNPLKLETGKRIAKKTMRLAVENVAFTVIVKLIILIMDIFLEKEMPLWVMTFGDVGVCFIAIANSLRALRVSKK
jgi:cation transport ATPase